MNTHKLSISLPDQQYQFIERYQEENQCTRSDVVKKAIYLLEQNYLEQCYKAANKESLAITKDFETTSFDGLEDETW